jgi:hypothetical protein
MCNADCTNVSRPTICNELQLDADSINVFNLYCNTVVGSTDRSLSQGMLLNRLTVGLSKTVSLIYIAYGMPRLATMSKGFLCSASLPPAT